MASASSELLTLTKFPGHVLVAHYQIAGQGEKKTSDTFACPLNMRKVW
jgi:hypothetical protein